jgi:hypothetical protein
LCVCAEGRGEERGTASTQPLGVRLEPRFVGVLPSDLQTPPAANTANVWELAWHPLAPHHQLAASFTVRRSSVVAGSISGSGNRALSGPNKEPRSPNGE